MELNGRFVTESDTIMALLEQTFPDNNPLLPPRGSDSAQVSNISPRTLIIAADPRSKHEGGRWRQIF